MYDSAEFHPAASLLCKEQRAKVDFHSDGHPPPPPLPPHKSMDLQLESVAHLSSAASTQTTSKKEKKK